MCIRGVLGSFVGMPLIMKIMNVVCIFPQCTALEICEWAAIVCESFQGVHKYVSASEGGGIIFSFDWSIYCGAIHQYKKKVQLCI